MSTISPTGAAATAAPASNAKLTADFNGFLKLLTAQLQNQDPTKPMDATQFTQQLVGFSQVEQQIQQTAKLQSILDRMAVNDLAAATTFVGREVETTTGEAPLGDDGAIWDYQLGVSAEATRLSISDTSGRVVVTLPGATDSGTHRLVWDGRMANGVRLPNGRYSLGVEAVTAAGSAVDVQASGRGRVNSVAIEGGTAVLDVGGMPLALAQVRSVGASR